MKHCPFCGGQAKIDALFIVQCTYCGARTSYFSEEEDAICAWNRRSKAEDTISVQEANEYAARAVDRAVEAHRKIIEAHESKKVYVALTLKIAELKKQLKEKGA